MPVSSSPVDHKGQQVDKTESRKYRQASLRVVKDMITPDRKMIVSGYDAFLGEVNVLVKFDKAWVECQVMYNQPVNCKQVGLSPKQKVIYFRKCQKVNIDITTCAYLYKISFYGRVNAEFHS